MKRFLLASILFVDVQFAVAQSPYASLQVPRQIQYQGRVATGIGAAWNGTEGYFMFAIFQGATVLWNNWEGQATGVTDPGTVASPGNSEVLTLPVTSGVFSVRLGDSTFSINTNKEIPPTVFFDTVTNSVRSGVKLAVWFSPDGGTFTQLSPDVDFTSVPFAMVSGIAETMKERAVTGAMLADNAVSSVKLLDGSITVIDLVDSVKQGLNPVGTVQIYAGSVTDTGALAEPVAGYLLCNGAVIDSSASGGKYASLVSAIQTAWGNGNDVSTSTANLPDLRGVFLRGWSGTVGDSYVDPDRNVRLARKPGGNTGNQVGSYQTDEFKSHSHAPPSGLTQPWLSNPFPGDGAIDSSNITGSTERNSQGGSTQSSGGSETRPKNANVNYIIKY